MMIENAIPKPMAATSVLVIDDEPGLRELLMAGLTRKGYRVVTAPSGREALEYARREPFDLAVCDLMLPGENGVQILEKLKVISPSTEVIMATGYATIQTAIQAIKKGAYDYIPKPYGVRQIVSLLEKAMETRNLKSKILHLEELNKLKSEYLAGTGHDLRSPMTAIIGYVSLLLQHVYGDVPVQQKETLMRIEASARRLLELINNIVELSQLTSNRSQLASSWFDLKELLQEVAQLREPMARDKELTLTYAGQEPLKIRNDRHKLRQVLGNLIDNAIKFTDKGSIQVRARLTTETPQHLEIVVEDTGVGIGHEDLLHLFEEFKELPVVPALKSNEGAGVGLVLCKKLVELMGGSIQVHSVKNQGTRFVVTLPSEIKDRAPDGQK